jgi:DNA-binding response OmpR family regulator
LNGQKEFHFRDLSIDFKANIVRIGKKEIDLAMTEYYVLQVLASNFEKLVTNENLLKEVWGDEHIRDAHMLHVNISHIRQKLNSNTVPDEYIETKQGLGYILKKR